MPIRCLISQTKSRNAVRAVETHSTSRAASNCLSQSPAAPARSGEGACLWSSLLRRLWRRWREARKGNQSFFQAFPGSPVLFSLLNLAWPKPLLSPFRPSSHDKNRKPPKHHSFCGSHEFNSEQDRQGGPHLHGACTQGFQNCPHKGRKNLRSAPPTPPCCFQKELRPRPPTDPVQAFFPLNPFPGRRRSEKGVGGEALDSEGCDWMPPG